MESILNVYNKVRALLGWLSGYLLFALVVLILLAGTVLDSGILAVSTTAQLLAVVAFMIFLLRMDVAVANEGLEKEVDTKTQKMTNAADRIEAAQSNINGAVRRLSTDVELMRETLASAGQLRTLEGAMIDLAPRFEAVKEGDEVLMDHLGLDMTTAWDRLCPVIEKLVVEKKAKIGLRLLILGKKAAGALGAGAGRKIPLPTAVEKWLGHGDGKCPTIEKALREIQQAAEASGKGALHYEIRSYRDLPVVHGIRIRGKLEAAYVAVCRWDDKRKEDDKFWWAGHEYHRVLGPASDQELDLMAILDGYFERWWAMNAKTEFASSKA